MSISRRRVLRLAGLGSALVGADALLSGCGSPSPTNMFTPAKIDAYWRTRHRTGSLSVASWPYYLDDGPAGSSAHPSLEAFRANDGISVGYAPIIDGTSSFLAAVEPALRRGSYCGYDLAVLPNGMALEHLMSNDYLIPLDHKLLANFATFADPRFKDPTYDPGNVFTVPWQSGITGIGYNPALTGGPITSITELFAKRFAGRVGMFSDSEDLANAALTVVGVNPSRSTVKDWRRAAALLATQRRSGIVKQYYGQEYLKALVQGEVWLAQAWSGDVVQARAAGAPLEFVVPTEGGLLWTDNLVVLRGARHPEDAMEYINYVYQPQVAKAMTETINFITPVPGVRALLQQDASQATGSAQHALIELADSRLCFPSNSDYNSFHQYRALRDKELQQWTAIFPPVRPI